MKKLITKSMAMDIGEAEMIPRWYGIAYRDFDRDTKVAYPIIIHWIVRYGRDLLYWIRWVGYPSFRQEVEHKYFRLGLEAGWKGCEYRVKYAEETAFTIGFREGQVAQIDLALRLNSETKINRSHNE